MESKVQTCYWWVNQNQTFRQEFEGGYLWSPQLKANGAINPFYEYMRQVKPGDVIFSFCDTVIKAIGIARSSAYPSPKPAEFGSAGPNWNKIGWRVDVHYSPLDNQISPKRHIETLRPLLPIRYSPLQHNGRGNQGVYLARIPHAFADKLIELIGAEAKMQARHFCSDLQGQGRNDNAASVFVAWEEHLIHEIQSNGSLDATQRQALVLARRGQGKFRDNVMKLEQGCRITGVTRPEHLRASHIKPWRNCVDSHERLAGANGLLLTPNIDHLFDRGFVSFENSGEILISEVVDPESVKRMGIDLDRRRSAGCFSTDQHAFLEYHRERVFLQARMGE